MSDNWGSDEKNFTESELQQINGVGIDYGTQRNPATDEKPIEPSDREAISVPLNPEACKRERFRILKNLLVLSLGFLFLFTAFQSLQNLQSSLNPDKGLGTASLSVIYGSLILSCMFVPPLMIGRLGCKWTLVLSMIAYVLFTAANYHARWWTMIPASMILGAFAAPLWASKSAYLTTTGIRLAEISDQHTEAIVTRFFGIFFFIFQSGQILGNIISSFVLDEGGPDSFRSDAGQVCGVHYCGSTPNKNMSGNSTEAEPLSNPEHNLVIKLLSIYLGSGILAIVIVIALLDRLTGNLSRKKDSVGGLALVVTTLRHLKDRRMQLVLTITIFSGLEQAFVFSDFTKGFVTCSLGINKVGFIMICFGVTDAAFSYILGRLTQYTGRLAIFISGLLVHVTVIIVMLSWSPDPELVSVFYILAALQGYCDAVWQTQVNALYGVYFSDNQEAAFSNFRLWQSLGFAAAFAYSNWLCIRVKLIILLCVLVLGVALYLVCEWVHRKHVRGMDVQGSTTEDEEMARQVAAWEPDLSQV